MKVFCNKQVPISIAIGVLSVGQSKEEHRKQGWTDGGTLATEVQPRNEAGRGGPGDGYCRVETRVNPSRSKPKVGVNPSFAWVRIGDGENGRMRNTWVFGRGQKGLEGCDRRPNVATSGIMV